MLVVSLKLLLDYLKFFILVVLMSVNYFGIPF